MRIPNRPGTARGKTIAVRGSAAHASASAGPPSAKRFRTHRRPGALLLSLAAAAAAAAVAVPASASASADSSQRCCH